MPSLTNKARFQYSLRFSQRARNVRLRVTFRRGLEVIVPKGYDTAKLPDLLERKKNWISAALERAENHRKFFEPEPIWRLPIQIKLPAIGKTWSVVAKETDAAWTAIRQISEDRILVSGKITNEPACRAALARWLMRQTREYLEPRLHSVSKRIGLRFRRVFVKRQRTRWASCSRSKSISLNAKMLFLPSDLVDYAMIHELCHLAEMNHSNRFWALLQRHCPDFRKLDSRLRDMWKVLPRWI